jgi:hypothetical protein
MFHHLLYLVANRKKGLNTLLWFINKMPNRNRKSFM